MSKDSGESDLLPAPGDVAADAATVMAAYRSGTVLALPKVDASAAQAEIAERMLGSATWEQLAGGSTVIKGHDFVNVPFLVGDVRWYPSAHFKPEDPKASPVAFAVMRGFLVEDGFEGAKGDAIIVSAGGWNVFAFLLKSQSEGWITEAAPKTLVIRQAEKPTAANRYPIWLEDFELVKKKDAERAERAAKAAQK